jgi:NodT family efflux transporter outer membrane factor (OMF) lipoprotein
VRQAQASSQQAGSARYPSITANSSLNASHQELSDVDFAMPGGRDDVSTQSSASIQLQYQLDFFGRNRASFAAATSREQAAEAEAASARLQLSTAIASTYAEFIRLNGDLDALEQAARMRQTSVALVRDRVAAGLENEGQAHQATSELSQTRADLIEVQAAIVRTRHALAALLGKGPDRGLTIEAPLGRRLNPVALPARVDLDLIGRRPDLAAARLNAEASGHNIDVARADFYPNINLVAIASLQTLGLEALGGGMLSGFQAGPAISLPIFDGGRIEGQYRGARASYDEAVAVYNQTLADALKEVADAISDRRSLERQLAEQRTGLEAAEASYQIAVTRYQGGLSSYIDTLNVESRLIQQRRAVAELEARAFSYDIALIRALGGGYAQS